MIRAILAGTATYLAAIGLTVTSAWLITRASDMPPILELTVAITAVRALGISRAVCRYTDRLVSHDVALSRASQTRTDTYLRLAQAPGRDIVGLRRGELLTRLSTDVDLLTDEIVRARIPAGVALMTSILVIAGTMILSPAAAGVLAAGLGISCLVAPALSAWVTRRHDPPRTAAVHRHVAITDRILRDAATLRMRGELDDALVVAREASRRALSSPAPDALARGLSVLSAGWTVVVMLGVISVSGHHSAQWVGVLALLPLAAFESTAVLPAAAVSYERARAARQRLGHLRATGGTGDSADTGAPATPTDREVPSIEITELELTHSHLAPLSFRVPAGGRLRVTAPSGTGKTTLLLTLAGLLPPKAGSLSHDPTACLCIAEDEHIFATTLRDILAVGAPHATDSDMLEVLGAVGLGEWVAGLADGLNTLFPHGAEGLSGGQRRRLLLARALLTDAPVLLLDEPDEHLDETGRDALEDLLARPLLPGARARRTVIVASHPRHDSGLLPTLELPLNES